MRASLSDDRQSGAEGPRVFIPGVHGHRGAPRTAKRGDAAPRWYPLRPHPLQWAMWSSAARFVVCHSGRRSGKTELAKRQVTIRAHAAPPDSRLFVCAPTWDQVSRVYWDDLVALCEQLPVLAGLPRGSTIRRKIRSAGDAHIELTTGTRIMLVTGAAADRAEGIEQGLLWGVVDEYGNMPPGVFGEVFRPQLAQTGGGAWLIGVPHGGGSHYQDVADRARAQGLARRYLAEADPEGAKATLSGFYGEDHVGLEAILSEGVGALEWDAFAWPSEDILPPAEVAKLAEDLDDQLFAQEARGEFVSYAGRAYKPFEREVHCAPLFGRYRSAAPLHFSLDFNVEPGAAAVGQDMELPGGERGTAYIGEVAIPQDATTELICRAFLEEWEGHAGRLYVRGDATGGQRSTAAADPGGSDWAIVRNMLRGRFPGGITYDIPAANPPEVDRVNAVNARLRSAAGAVRVGIDPARCPNLCRDLERVGWMRGVRKLDKSDPTRTHWSDAMGYDLAKRFPVVAEGGVEARADYFLVA